MIDISKVYEGWRNHIAPPKYLRKIIKEVSKERLQLCWECPMHSRFHPSFRPDAHCTDCGCTLSAKTKCLSCECPLPVPKWGPVVTPEQEEIMTEGNEKETG
jgi:hypothetical protein